MIEINKPIVKGNIPDYNDVDLIAEPKLDGMRCLMQKIDNDFRLLSENGINKTYTFPEITEKYQDIFPNNTIIDGEICCLVNDYKAHFNNLQQRSNLQNPFKIKNIQKKYLVTFMAFDILQYDDRELRYNSYDSRRENLNELAQKIKLSVTKSSSIDKMWKMILGMQGEGIVIKPRSKDYYAKWIKIKNWIESDFIVKDYTSESKLISALELIDKEGHYVGKVNYTGYPQTKEFANTLKGKTAVVKYLEKSDNQKLRIPILKELR